MDDMSKPKFDKSFTNQEPIPEEGIQRAVGILKSGKLHRYNLDEKEIGDVSHLESEFSRWQGVDFCLACTSGGYALQLALRAIGVKQGDQILANAYTLAPVAGAIHNVGALPILVEIDQNYHIDLEDLYSKAVSSRSKFLLLSHMRGHIVDMNKLLKICVELDICLIEDCAHTMGAKWDGKRSGNFGKVSVFSTQTYKHINSGEGGFLTTNDEEIAAIAVILSGSYMLYERHGAIPSKESFDKVRLSSPNYSGRMDQLRASILRVQLPRLEENIVRWNRLYQKLFKNLSKVEGITIPDRVDKEFYVGSSIQFRVNIPSPEEIERFLNSCARRGVQLKWFGDTQPKGYTSRYDSWKFFNDIPHLSQTLEILRNTIDMRIPLTFNEQDCILICNIIEEELESSEKTNQVVYY